MSQTRKPRTLADVQVLGRAGEPRYTFHVEPETGDGWIQVRKADLISTGLLPRDPQSRQCDPDACDGNHVFLWLPRTGESDGSRFIRALALSEGYADHKSCSVYRNYLALGYPAGGMSGRLSGFGPVRVAELKDAARA